MKGSIYFSNNQCKILYQDEYLFVCVVISHHRPNKCTQCSQSDVKYSQCIVFIIFDVTGSDWLTAIFVNPGSCHASSKIVAVKYSSIVAGRSELIYLFLLILPNVLRSSKLLRDKHFAYSINFYSLTNRYPGGQSSPQNCMFLQ